MKILGYEYKLTNDGDVDSMGAFGRFNSRSQELKIAGDLCEQQIVSTTLHEIIEALNFHLSWKLEHSVITGMEAALYQTLSENGVDLRPIASEILNRTNGRVHAESEQANEPVCKECFGYGGFHSDNCSHTR